MEVLETLMIYGLGAKEEDAEDKSMLRCRDTRFVLSQLHFTVMINHSHVVSPSRISFINPYKIRFERHYLIWYSHISSSNTSFSTTSWVACDFQRLDNTSIHLWLAFVVSFDITLCFRATFRQSSVRCGLNREVGSGGNFSANPAPLRCGAYEFNKIVLLPLFHIRHS